MCVPAIFTFTCKRNQQFCARYHFIFVLCLVSSCRRCHFCPAAIFLLSIDVVQKNVGWPILCLSDELQTVNCCLMPGKLQRTSFSCHWCLGDSIIRGCAGSAIFGPRRLFLSMPFIASCFASGSTSDQCLLQGQHKTKFLCCPWLAVPVDFQSRPRPDLARQH